MPYRSPLERFWEKIEISWVTGCWIWTGGHKKAGYGQFIVDNHKVIAHRWSYEHFVGPIPAGYEVDHETCHNPACVNPAHLEAVTLLENRRRRNARKTHCVNQHEYTPENTAWQTDAAGYRSRYCKTCNRLKQQRRRAAAPSRRRPGAHARVGVTGQPHGWVGVSNARRPRGLQ